MAQNEIQISIQACHAVARLARIVEKAIDGTELTTASYRLLGQLSIGGEEAAAVLAEKLLVSRPTVTTTVDWLVARGMVTRTQDPADGRRVRIAETAEGAEALQRCNLLLAARLTEILSYLPDETTRLVADSLDALYPALTTDRVKRHIDHLSTGTLAP